MTLEYTFTTVVIVAAVMAAPVAEVIEEEIQ
jgi:hypothetical protein